MNPETLLAELSNGNDEISTAMKTANQAFLGLLSLGVPVQYAIHTGGKKPVIVDTDEISAIQKIITEDTLNWTLEDYKYRVKRNELTFNQFVSDNCSRQSKAMTGLMNIEIGWAFFYWCLLSRIREERKVPPAFNFKIMNSHFGAHHG